ncbi:MAG: serine/threonine protein kinase, partial [Anaerolineaceae bacterium]|nr:serine/threonine protein kinase [Anaerolineaceae bacterium]
MNRCPYCFKPLPEYGVCSCHYEENQYFTNREVLHPGSIVGASYQIGMVLGQGGFGITYHGFDLDLEKEVAIKEFYPKGLVARLGAISYPVSKTASNVSQVVAVSSDNNDYYQKSLKSFYKEAKALANMSHISNVAHVYRIFRENDTAYMVMDFIEGKSLRQMLLEKNRPFSENELLPLLDPVLDALQKVHEMGIVHRDIAPDNIVINSNGEPVLLDFGASKLEHMQNSDDDHQASSSLIVQKKGYSPVEQLSGESDLRSDIYALGATYYTLLAGRVPQESIKRAMRDDVRPLSEYGISPAVSNAVTKAMAVNIDDRWNSVAEFRRALSDRTGTDSGTERTYNQARDLMMFEKYDEAAAILSRISGYKDSDKLLDQCREQISRRVENERTYNQARDLMQYEKYDEAADLLSRISGYEDSETLLNQCREQISRKVEPFPEEKPLNKAELPTVYTKLPDEIINNTYITKKKKEKEEIREKEKKKFPLIPVILVLAVIAAVVSILLGTKTITLGSPTQTPSAAEIKAGDEYTFGRYEQDGASGADVIKWQVLAVENG